MALEESGASISLQISSIVTNFKNKQSKEFLACLILKTLACWEKLSAILRADSLLKSDNVGRSILGVSAIS